MPWYDPEDHPTDDGLRSYDENGEMYLLMDDQDTVAGIRRGYYGQKLV